ncbi:hypothetical protein ACFU6I_25810 [Streptomyces sp. NPDC057486]
MEAPVTPATIRELGVLAQKVRAKITTMVLDGVARARTGIRARRQ